MSSSSSTPPPGVFREVERKLRVHGRYEVPDLSHREPGRIHVVATAEPAGSFVQTAVYFDTPDLRLARSKVTLRRREGGVDDGWHVKLPADDDTPDARDEVRLPLEASTDGEPPPALLELVVSLTLGAAVEPVATLRTARSATLLRAPDGRAIAELTDDHVELVDGGQVAARFRELEVESREGTKTELDAVVARLVEAGAIEGGLTSKVARALGAAAAAPPDLGPPEELGRKSTAGEVLTAHLVRHTRAFLAQDLRLRRDLPDAVHQLRVAARRLRSGLKAFGPLVEQAWADTLRTELAWVASELGEIRDREVLEEHLLADLAALSTDHGADSRDVQAAASVVRRAFDDERASAKAEVDEALRSERYVSLLSALVEAAQHPHLSTTAAERADTVLPSLVTKTWKRLAKDVRGLDLEGSDDSWHEARIAAKRARYAAEAVVPVFGAPAKKWVRQMESITELLGGHQDTVIAAMTTRRLAGGRRVTGTTGFVLGQLHDAERARVVAIRHELVAIWPDVSAPRHRRWLEKLG